MLTRKTVERFVAQGHSPALVDEAGRTFSYVELADLIAAWSARLDGLGIAPGTVVAINGSYTAPWIAAFWALVLRGNILVPLVPESPGKDPANRVAAEIAWELEIGVDGCEQWTKYATDSVHPLLQSLRADKAPGLILFTSGTTGRPKIVLHSFEKLLSKYRPPLKAFRTLQFLAPDHIAAIDTMLYTLSAGGTCVIENTRQPEHVCQVVARHSVQVLSATPSFLRLVLLSEAHQRYDLSSLNIVTYGSEPMPSALLEQLTAQLPHVHFVQKYGMTELGSPPSRSRGNGELWMKMGSDTHQMKVVDGILWIKAETAMVGYLNAPSPFDAKGWFNTNDAVEVDGEWLRILGRASDIINVGGNKVYPSEVESVLLQMADVTDTRVWGEVNPILGQMVVARITVETQESLASVRHRVREFCRTRLASYKIPAKVVLGDPSEINYRFKRTGTS